MEIRRISNKAIIIKGKKESIAIDTEGVKTDARVVVATSNRKVKLNTFGLIEIAGPGEYEAGGVEITGIKIDAERTMYQIVIDGVSVVVIGEVAEELNDKKKDKINGTDVLIVGIGNGISGKKAIEYGKAWGANYVVPVGTNNESNEMKKFLDESDNEGKEPIDTLKVDKDNLPDGMEVVLLNVGK